MCGERFTQRREQDALLGVLHMTENDHGWPTAVATQALAEMWDRDDIGKGEGEGL